MNINVTATKVTIDKGNVVNKGEYNIRDCIFTLSEEYNDLVCKALFTIEKNNKTYEQSIVNNKCTIPYEVTVEKGAITLGVIGYEIEDDELIKRYSPLPYHFTIEDGSYVEDIENQSTPTPTELEQLEQRVSQVEIDAAQVEINTQDISDIKQEQTTQNNDILLRSLITETGSQIELSLNSTNFKMTATLKDKNGTVVNTSNEIDLPLESVVVNASYDSTTKEIILTLQNGNTVRFSVADLVSGLQTEITSSNKLSSDLVDDSTSTNKFVTASEKTQITTNKNNITSLNTNKEDKSNKVTSLSSSSTDTQYPSAKAVYDNLITKADKSSLVSGEGTEVTLQKTAELEFIQPPLPMGNSEQVQIDNILTLTEVDGGGYDVAPTLTNGIVNIKGRNNTNYNTKGFFQNGFVNLKNTQKWKDDTKYYISCKLEVVSNQKNLDTTYFSCFLYGEKVFEIRYNTTLQRYTGTVTTATLTDSQKDKTFFEIRVDGTELNISEISVKTTEDYTFNGYGTQPSPEQEAPISNVTGDVEVVVQNKNLLKYKANNFDSLGGVTGVVDNDGGIILNGTTSVTNFMNISRQDLSGSNYSAVLIGNTNNNVSITHEKTGVFIRVSSGVTLTNLKIFPMVTYSSITATTYTPHQEQTYTFPLGTQRMYLGDYLADDGIHSKRDIDIFDGSDDEVWALIDAYFVSPYVENVAYRTVNSICNIATIKTLASLSATDINKYGVQTIPNGRSRFFFRCSQFGTLDDWKAYLAENPITVEYELATEEITPYTEPQQQAYDEIKQAFSYKEQTNISGSSDESNPLFEVQAVQYKEPDYWTIAYVNGQIGNAIGGAY